jgi:hypothetical protein
MASIVAREGAPRRQPRGYPPLPPWVIRRRRRRHRAQAGINLRLTTSRLTGCHDERMTDSHDTRAGPAAGPAAQERPRVRRWFGYLMLAEAVTFWVASYLHLAGSIPLGFTTVHGEQFGGAATPEAVIGTVLAAGAVLVLAAARQARGIALGTTAFAAAGVIIGLNVIIGSSRPAADYVYHAVILVALLVTFLLLLLDGRQRVRSL